MSPPLPPPWLLPFLQASAGFLTGKDAAVTILYTNDVHTYIDNKSPKLTYAAIAAMKQGYVDEGKPVLLVDAGDHIQGTAYGSMDDGATIIELMNEAGYDIATPGNHEFDYGMARAKAIIKEADFPLCLLQLGGPAHRPARPARCQAVPRRRQVDRIRGHHDPPSPSQSPLLLTS